jgi:hypothetical protein
MYTAFRNFAEFAAPGVVDYFFQSYVFCLLNVGVERDLCNLSRSMKHTIGRTPLDEGSARLRVLCLTTHNGYKRQTFLPPGGIRTRNVSKWTAAVEMLAFKECHNAAWCKKPDYSLDHKTAALHPKPETSHSCVSHTPHALWQDCSENLGLLITFILHRNLTFKPRRLCTGNSLVPRKVK